MLKHPLSFLLRAFRDFRANQGFLLAGAVAYYTLLSIIPLFSLLLVALSHIVDEVLLMDTLTRYAQLVLPERSTEVVEQIATFLSHRDVFSWFLVIVLLFFSSIAFSVLENALSVIFYHRVAIRHRHVITSALIPFLFIFLLGVGFLIVTFIASGLQAIEETHLILLGLDLSLGPVSAGLLYLLGLGGQILMLTAIYMVMPVGQMSWRHALVGGITAGLLWEITRHLLVWYFSTLSLINVVYGSLATVIIVLLTLEVAAVILLFGAQVIAEYERFKQKGTLKGPSEPLRTSALPR